MTCPSPALIMNDRAYRLPMFKSIALLNIGATRYCPACSAYHVIDKVLFDKYAPDDIEQYYVYAASCALVGK